MNKFAKTIFPLLLLLPLTVARAEDVLQVTPFTTVAGVAEGSDETFSIEMTNTQSYTALEFNLYLPEGMTLIMNSDDYDPMELSSERFPGKTRKGVFIPNHDSDVTQQSDGHYYITIYNTDLETISGTEGELLIFYYETAADMPAGIYPITITGTVLGVDSHTGVTIPTSTSYVKVGAPTDATLPLSGYVPSFVNEALATETSIGTLDLTAVTGMGGTLTLVDGRGLVPPAGEVTVPQVTYSRQMTNEWGTVCLPFAVQSDATMQLYQLSSQQGNVLYFDEIDRVEAGCPAVFRKLSGDGVTLTAENAALATGLTDVQSVFTLKGVYAQTTVTVDEAAPSYYIATNQFKKGTGYFTVAPFRAYFQSATASEVKAFRIVGSGEEATGIEAVSPQTVDDDGPVYDLTGRRLSAVPVRGMYIENGQKKYVK